MAKVTQTAAVGRASFLALNLVIKQTFLFRYFVIKVTDGGGKAAYLGLGFADRADSFDLNTTLHDHFKGILVSRLM